MRAGLFLPLFYFLPSRLRRSEISRRTYLIITPADLSRALMRKKKSYAARHLAAAPRDSFLMGPAYIHRNQSTVQTLSTATATLKFNPNTPKTMFLRAIFHWGSLRCFLRKIFTRIILETPLEGTLDLRKFRDNSALRIP